MVQEEGATKGPYSADVPATHILQRLSDALSSFTVPDQNVLERTSKGFSKSPVQEIDEYFELVAKLGRPLFKWDIIRCAFLWKLEQTMSEMLCIETENAVTENEKKTLVSDDDLYQQRQFILRKAAEFDGTPFTFQRLCELLISPSRHYKRTDKYLRALEKNINVVTTITESGERITGVEPFPGELDINSTARIEEPFFVQVDECDAPVETKVIAAGDHVSRENKSPEIVAKELAIGDCAPINLSSSRDAKDELPEIKQENLEHETERNSLLNEPLRKPETHNVKQEEMKVVN
uniref:BMA-PPFR-2, isoform a n=1 Tax=Brugia malayi TaxID=6279 RepID=A0A0K0J8P0_BRUMA|nr:BMA-PPFR-2, isoform b [Brugia malayi]